MKTQGQLSAGVVLLTLFFLLTACTTATTGIQQGSGAAPTVSTKAKTPAVVVHTSPTVGATKRTTAPKTIAVNNITLPPQATEQPLPTATPRVQPTPTPAPTSSSGGSAGLPSIPAAAQAVLVVINQERASAGKPPLQMSDVLIRSAHKHNLRMVAANQLSHQLPGEPDLGTRVRQEGVTWWQISENIGYGWGDATQTAVGLNKWMFSEKPPDDGHRVNILSNANLVGIDVVINPSISQVWLTEDFAQTT